MIAAEGRTPFQKSCLQQIEANPNFAKWAADEFSLDETCKDYKGPFVAMWFDNDNRLHATKIGQRRVLKEAVA